MWVSHVRGEGKDGDGEVSKMITQHLRTLWQGDTIGDVDLALRRTNLASVIVSSDTCELVHMSIYVCLRHHYCTPSTNAHYTERCVSSWEYLVPLEVSLVRRNSDLMRDTFTSG